MNQSFAQIGFSIEITEDGSPTLRLPTTDQGRSESMHHSGGAAAETNYIYGRVLEQALRLKPDDCKTCIVGLGLGYIEISWAQALIRNHQVPSPTVFFESFEVVPGLQDRFKSWVKQNPEQLQIYDLIASQLDPSISSLEVQKKIQQAFATKSTLENNFLDCLQTKKKWNVICYDAFSQKTNHPLWQADFLNQLIQNHTEDDCVFTTYACTGVLKKVLTENGFHLFKRPGFQGKRDSTLAGRGCFKSGLSPDQTF